MESLVDGTAYFRIHKFRLDFDDVVQIKPWKSWGEFIGILFVFRFEINPGVGNDISDPLFNLIVDYFQLLNDKPISVFDFYDNQDIIGAEMHTF